MGKMTCEKCRRYIEAEDSRKQARRLVMARADRTPEYEIVLFRECAEAVLEFIYKRSADEVAFRDEMRLW